MQRSLGVTEAALKIAQAEKTLAKANQEKVEAELKATLALIELTKAKAELASLQATIPTVVETNKPATVTKSSIFKATLEPVKASEVVAQQNKEYPSPSSPWYASPVNSGWYSS